MSRISPPTDAASLGGTTGTVPAWARVLLLAATLMVAACGSGNGDDPEPDENTAPTARAGTDQTANPGATVTLDGSESSDTESTTLSYSWEFTPDREDVTLSSTSAVAPTFTAPSVTEDADLIFTLTVTDAGGLTDTDTVTVVINAPPTAVPAGPSESVSSNAPVTIDGSGSTDAVRYAWRQVQVGSEPTITLGDTDGATLIFTAPTVATETTFTFELEVTDADGATHAARVEVVVAASETPGPGPRPANQAPTADAGEGGAVNAGTVVTLNGLDSKDPEGGDLDYSWTQRSPAMPPVELSGEDAAIATFTAPTVTENTTFVFQLEVTDDGGLTATAEVSITVSSTVLSMVPRARAAADDTVRPNNVATLDGSGSGIVGGGTVASYRWTQQAPPMPVVVLADATAAIATFTVPDVADGTVFTFRLEVTSASGLTATDEVSITISSSALIVSVGTDREQAPNSEVVLDGSGSSAAEGADIASYHWMQISPSSPTVTLAGADTAIATFTAPFVARDTTFTFQLTVTDSLQETRTNTVSITVPNTPPTVVVAEGDRTLNPRAPVTLDGSGSTDPGGGITSYEWTQQSPPSPVVALANEDTAVATFAAPSVAVSTAFVFRLEVEDAAGLTAMADVTITVMPPTARAGDDQAVNAGAPVTLDGSNSSGVGTITYAWEQLSGSAAALDDNASATPVLATDGITADATLVYQLTVTDGRGNEATDTVSIAVNAPPTADAGADGTANAAASVTLTGSGDGGTLGGELRYAWTQAAGQQPAATFDAAAVAMATLVFDAPATTTDATLTFTLTVTDAAGLSSADEASVNLNAPPTVTATANSPVLARQTVTLTGTGDTGMHGGDLGYVWTQMAGTPMVSLSDATIEAPTFTAPPVAATTTFTFVLTATDANGLSNTAEVSVVVNPSSTADAGADQTVQAFQKVVLDGSASTGPGGTAVTYSWTQALPAGVPTIELSSSTAARPNFIAPSMLESAALTFTLTVTGPAPGNLTHADEVTITVEKAELGTIRGMSISDDGTRAVSGGSDGTVRLWDVSAGMEIRFDHDTVPGGRPLGEHDGQVYAVAISGDGKRAISGGADGVLHVWYTDPDGSEYGNEVTYTNPYTGLIGGLAMPASNIFVYAVAMDQDGTRAAAGGFDGIVRIWNTDTEDTDLFDGDNQAGGVELTFGQGANRRTLDGHGDNSVYALSFSDDGCLLLSGGADGTVRLWDATNDILDPDCTSSTPFSELRQFVDNDGTSMGPVFAVAISGDGATVAAGGADNHVRVWAASDGTMERHELDHDADVTSVSLNTDGTRLLSTDGNGNVRLYNVESGDAGDGDQIHAVRAHTDYVWSASLSGVDKTAGTAVTGGADGLINVWGITDTPSDNAEAFTTTPSEPPNIDPAPLGDMIPMELVGHTNSVNAVALSADGSRALSGSGTFTGADKTVRFWNTTTRTEITFPDGAGGTRSLGSHGSRVVSVSLSANGRIALSGGDNHGLNVWDTTTGQIQQNLLADRTNNINIVDVSLSANGRRALIAGFETPDEFTYTGFLELFDVVTGNSLHKEASATDINDGHVGFSIVGAALSADGHFALSGGTYATGQDDRTVRLWRTDPFAEVRHPIIGVDGPPYLGRHDTHTNDEDDTFAAVYGVALSADGGFALSGSDAQSVHFYNTATRDRIIMDHGEEVVDVALSADGRLALSVSRTGGDSTNSLRLWHPATGTLLRAGTVHRGRNVSGAALSADGRIGLSGGAEGKLYLWHIGRSRGPSVPTVTAVAGEDRTEAPLSQVVLNGSDSGDAKGNKPIGYAWRQASGEPAVTLSDKNVAAPTFTAPGVTATTTLTFELSVTGADGLVDTSQVTITINPALAAHAGPDQRVAFGASVTLDGSASHDPAGGTPTYAWTAPAGITLTGADTASPTFTAPADTLNTADPANSVASILLKTLTFTLTVTDANGNTAQDSVTIGVGGTDDSINDLFNVWASTGRSTARTAVRSVAFVKASTITNPVAVMASLNGTVDGWSMRTPHDPATSDALIPLGSYEGAAYAVAVSGTEVTDPQRRLKMIAIAGGIDGVVRVWDEIDRAKTQYEVGDGEHLWVYAVAISQDGTRAATGGFDGKIRLWDLSTISAITEITYGSDTRSLGDHGNHSVYALSMSDDGTRLLSGGADGTVRLWNTETSGTGAGTVIRTFEAADGDPTGQIFGVALSGDKQIAVAGGADNNIHMWDAATGEELYDLKGHAADVSSVALSTDKTRVLSGGGDGTVRLWNVDVSDAEGAGSQIYSRRLHSDYVWSVALHDAAGLALSGGADTKLNLWRTNEPPPDITEPFATVEQDRDPAFTGDVRLQLLGAHESDATDVALTKDGRFAVSVGDTNDRTARLWDAITGDLLHVISFGTGLSFAEKVVLSADGRLVAFGRHDQFVSFWTIEEDQANGTTKLVSLRDGPTTGTGVIDDLSMTPDGRLAISGDRVGDVRLLDPHTGQEILFGGSSFYDGTQIKSVAISADGKVVLLADSGTDIEELLWTGVDANAGTRTAQGTRTKIRDVEPRDIQLSADGSRAVITLDLKIIFRDLATGTGDDLHTAEVSPLGTVASAAMTLDARLALTGAQGGRTWLWDAANHEVLRRTTVGLVNPLAVRSVRGASLSADGRVAVTDDSDGTVYVYRFDRSDAAVASTTATAVASASSTSPAQGATVTLNGACSSDSRGTVLTLTGCTESHANTSKKPLAYYWRQTAGTAGTLSANNVAAPTFTVPSADGSITLELIVTDALGLTASADVTLTVGSGGKAPGRLAGTGSGGAALTASNTSPDAYSSHPRGGIRTLTLANARDAQSAADGACISRTNAAGETLHGTARGIHCVYPADFADADNPLAHDTTIPALPAGGAHIFAGSLVVGRAADAGSADAEHADTGPALTVAPGAILAFDGSSSTLIVNPGARLLAVGTAANPITLTSAADAQGTMLEPGAEANWNGLVIHGDGADEVGSGSSQLNYIVVKHAGSEASSGSVTLHNVGGGTAIGNLQVYTARGNGLAVVGGAATIENFVAVYVHGNSIDLSGAWSGTLTNALVIQPEHGGDHCLDAGDVASGTISGLTCITSAHTAAQAQGLGTGIRLGANAALTIERSMVVGTFAGDTDERTNYCLGIDNASPQTAATLDGNVFACADQANSTAAVAWATTHNNQFANIPAPTDPTAATDTHLQLLGGTPPVYSLDYEDLRIDGADTTVTPPNGADFPGAASESVPASWLRPNGIDWTYGIFQGSRAEPLWFEGAR